MNKKILMVCYYYPPLTDVGCKRSVAFSKYLLKHGWQPYVLSVKNPDRAYCSMGNDSGPEGVPTVYSRSLINLYRITSLINSVITKCLGVLKIRVRRNYLFEFFCIPDYFWGWIPLTTLKGLKLIRKEKIDTIYVSCTPYSSALIGVLLKWLTHKRLIIDFRDQFALDLPQLYTIKAPPTGLRKWINSWYVRTVLKRADEFIVTTDEIKELYIRQFPLTKTKIHTIHNGFEAELLKSVIPEQKFSRFTVIYTGDFYSYVLEPSLFFKALAMLKERGDIHKENFRFLFYGDAKEEIEQIASRYDVEDLVDAHFRIPYSDVLKDLTRSHLQLLRIMKPMISTKLFEGIPMNIPFIATIPEGEVETIIRKYSPGSYIVTEDSTEKAATSIKDAMQKYMDNQVENNRITEFLSDFSREQLTGRLVMILLHNRNNSGSFDSRGGQGLDGRI